MSSETVNIELRVGECVAYIRKIQHGHSAGAEKRGHEGNRQSIYGVVLRCLE